MNIKEIKELINIMNENGLVELEIEKEGMRIRIKKPSGTSEVVPSVIIEKQPQTVAGVTKEEPLEKVLPKKTVEIKSPMVGTFYRAPSPEAPPYVEIGSIVEPGQVICIIEAMKLMNEIKSDIKAKILEILVDNAEPVEFGQPLFLVEPL
ncbi:MAG: acetyl-CoA carboxylase biotin carboxyl carrier protein [Candidatus Omnitrophica bacterium]|nr:acetyl-CoA carboxylase biotin carboxyl carrier protein [Candidatus Omnitrophota bacterium]